MGAIEILVNPEPIFKPIPPPNWTFFQNLELLDGTTFVESWEKTELVAKSKKNILKKVFFKILFFKFHLIKVRKKQLNIIIKRYFCYNFTI